MTIPWRQSLAVALCGATVLSGQQMTIEPQRPTSSIFVRPYQAVTVPDVRLANSGRLGQLVRAGNLYLTAEDAVALALENNIDIEVARYSHPMAEWRLERAQAGGLLPGVPSVASQAGTVAAGQGVTGSQQAAGVQLAGGRAGAGNAGNATISQIGPVTQTLDPSIQGTAAFAHTSSPQANSVQSLVTNLIANTRVYNATYQQGFLSGGSISVTAKENYLNENAPTDLLNPSMAPNLSISGQHNLLRGFGVAVNARTITVSKINLRMSDAAFETQVSGIVAQVLNTYYSYSSTWETLKSQRSIAEVAATFYGNVKRQVDIGQTAPTELITAENQMITSQQTLVASEATLRQQEVRLKSLLSRNGTADPVLRSARIVPVDRITMPASENLPPLDEMVRQAMSRRTDLASQKANEEAAVISAQGTKNGILPTLVGFGAMSAAGLAGDPRTVISGGTVTTPDPYFVGGLGTAWAMVFRRNFPTQRGGVFYQGNITNGQAQADYAIDMLQLRQSQLGNRKSLSQVEVDVQNAVLALQQARVRYEAAVKNRELQSQLFEAESKKFEYGVSTSYDVTRQQRDMITAQSNEQGALLTYVTARIALDQTLGTILDAHRVTIAEAKQGKLQRESSVPEVVPEKP